MTAVNHVRGTKLVLLVGDGASPEVFAPKCSINSDRSIQFTSNMTGTPIPDCDDVDALAAIVNDKTDIQATVSGAGLLNVGDDLEFAQWALSKDPKNCKVVVQSTGGLTTTAAFHLGDFTINGTREGKVDVSISLTSTGPITVAATS